MCRSNTIALSWQCILLQVPKLIINYFLEVKSLTLLIKFYWVIFLIVKPNSCFVFASSCIAQGLNQVWSLVNDNIVLNVWIFFIFNLEVVSWELLNGKIGGADSSGMTDNVCSFSYSSSKDVVYVRLISFRGHWIYEILNIFLGFLKLKLSKIIAQITLFSSSILLQI